MSYLAREAIREAEERAERLRARLAGLPVTEAHAPARTGDAPRHPWCHAEGDIVFFRAPDGAQVSDADVEAAYSAIHAWWSTRTRPACFVTDLSSSPATTATQRKIAAAWEAKFRPYATRYGAAAIIAPSAALRGLVTAVFWISSPGYPYAIVSTQGQAIMWAQKYLKGKA